MACPRTEIARGGPSRPEDRQAGLDPDDDRHDAVDRLRAARDVVGERVGQRVADQLAGHGRAVSRSAVGVRAIPGTLGGRGDQRVAHVQREAELEQRQEQEREQDADQREVDDGGPAVVAAGSAVARLIRVSCR